MSANIVDTKMIDVLLTYALTCLHNQPLRWLWPDVSYPSAFEPGIAITEMSVVAALELRNELTYETVDRVGQMLVDENYKSVNFRYDENSEPIPYTYKQFPLVKYEISPANLLGLLDNYEYQTCEHPEWQKSEAHKFVNCLRRAIIHDLPGYDWSIKSKRRKQ